MPDEGQRYWGFLSYSHDDVRWARWLHRALEGYAVPRRLVGRPTPAGVTPARLRPIFRDREELGAGSDLGERLTTALQGSAYLIVICSPAAARSRWVEEEVSRFKTLHGADRVLALIVGGEPFASDQPEQAAMECFPRALRLQLDPDGQGGERRVDPLAADVRPGKDGRRLALLKLASGMLRVDLDELIQRDARRRHQQLLALTAASLTGSVVLAGLSVTAIQERNEAVAQRAQAEGLIEFMIKDLKGNLEPTGRLDALDSVGGRALAYYSAQKGHNLDAASLGRRARVLHLLGDIRDRRGDLGGALKVFQEAAASTGELLARAPGDPQRIFDHAQSVYWVGYVAWRRGDLDVALQEFGAYQRLADQLVSIDPKNQDWQLEVGYANANLGTALLDSGRADDAAQAYGRALGIARAVVAEAPRNRDRQFLLAQTYGWLSDVELQRGRLEAASANRLAERAVYQDIIQRTPGDEDTALALAVNRTAVAQILIAQGSTQGAIAELNAANSDMIRLMSASPDDLSYKAMAAKTFVTLGQVLLQTGDLATAEAIARRARDLAEELVAKDPSVAEGRRLALGSARVLMIKITCARTASAAGRKSCLQPSLAEAERLGALSAAKPHSLGLARTAGEAALLAGDYESVSGAPDQARQWWSAAAALMTRARMASVPPSDRGQAILRQLSFRLTFGHPPFGPLSASKTAIGRSAQAGDRSEIDYKW
ncbi:MAG: TIR domain-containing protein [Caulobacterales bacterium]